MTNTSHHGIKVFISEIYYICQRLAVRLFEGAFTKAKSNHSLNSLVISLDLACLI